MRTNSFIDWRFLRRHFLISFVGVLIFAIIFYSVRYFISWNHQGFLEVAVPGFLFCICAWRSSQSINILQVFVATAGVIWGTVLSLSVANFIEDADHVPGWLPTMIHGSLIMPVVATVTVLPFWYFGRRLPDWNIRGASYCLKIALITPLVLIGVYTVTFACYWFLSPSQVTAWQGKRLREVSFKTSIPEYWRPAFWSVECIFKYENYQSAGGVYYDILVFRKFLDSPNQSRGRVKTPAQGE